MYYSAKNLFPILGDHRYSSRVKTIFGRPVLAPNQREQKPTTQVRNKNIFFCVLQNFINKYNKVYSQHVLKCLKINDYLRDLVPLHLQLYEINIEKKFKKQKLTLKHKLPLQEYFKETLKNFYLNTPEE